LHHRQGKGTVHLIRNHIYIQTSLLLRLPPGMLQILSIIGGVIPTTRSRKPQLTHQIQMAS
jgi:hypothetical protein